MDTLLLKADDVVGIVSMGEVVEVVERAFREKTMKRVQMPPKVYLNFATHGGDLRVMPAYLQEGEIAGVKIVNSHPNNRSVNLPTVMASIVLVDPKTGFPLAIMDGTWITAMRTGAASAVATKYLARPESRRAAIIGAGAQARTQLSGVMAVVNLEEVRVYDLVKGNVRKLVEHLRAAYPGLKVFGVETIAEAVKGVDVVITAVPSREPVIKEEHVEEGMHLNAIGADAPEKVELDPAVLRRGKVVVDDREQAHHSGNLALALKSGAIAEDDVYGEIGEIVGGFKQGRTSSREITIFLSTGLAVQDIATARLVYDRALELGRGRPVKLVAC